MRWVGGVESRSRPVPLGGQPTNWEDDHNCRGSPEAWSVSSTSGSPAHWSCTRKTNPQKPQALALNTSRAVKSRDFTLKGAQNVSHCPGPKAQAVIGKEPGSYPPSYLGEPPRESGGNHRAPRGYRHWQSPFWGAHSNLWPLVLARIILESSFHSLAPGPPGPAARDPRSWLHPLVNWHSPVSSFTHQWADTSPAPFGPQPLSPVVPGFPAARDPRTCLCPPVGWY